MDIFSPKSFVSDMVEETKNLKRVKRREESTNALNDVHSFRKWGRLVFQSKVEVGFESLNYSSILWFGKTVPLKIIT